MPIQEIGLAVSLFAGALFLLAALRRRPDRVPAPEAASGTALEMGSDVPAHPPVIYWPLLLGTGQRHFDHAMRLAIVRQLAVADKDWRLPILLCAREQETDPEMLAAIEKALGDTVKPVIGSPPA